MASASTFPTSCGAFSVIVDDLAVLASGWTEHPTKLIPLIHPTLRPTTLSVAGARLREVEHLVADYFDGDLSAIEQVPVLQRSGPFRMHAWQVLREVRSPISYGEFARRAGNPRAARAAAAACSHNAAALFVPCHRIVRSDGAVGQFAWGEEIKHSLLDHEREAAA